MEIRKKNRIRSWFVNSVMFVYCFYVNNLMLNLFNFDFRIKEVLSVLCISII